MERLKPDMKDHYSIFAQHYMAAGAEAISYSVSHFTTFSNTNLFAIPELENINK